MNLDALIAEFRREADDRVSPYLWQRGDIIAYACDAEREAARRALLLLDSSGGPVCNYVVTSGQPVVNIDSRVIRIARARLVTAGVTLSIVSHRTMDVQKPAWESDTGTPRVLIPDWTTGAVRLTPKPIAGDTLFLSVYRLPLEAMAESDDEPEIHEEHHQALVHWMLYRAYIRPDVDTFNAQAAATHLQAFTERFGPAPANSERVRRDATRARYEETK